MEDSREKTKTKRKAPCPPGTKFDIKTGVCVAHNKTLKKND